jgi:hypothetical protein
MAVYGGFNYTNFKGVNFKNTAFIRVEGDGGFNSTFSVPSSDDAARAYRFPAKSGTLPIMGTFSVQLPSIASVHYSTAVTVSGIRAEDAVMVQFNGTNTAGTTYGFEQSTGYIISQVKPTNGGLNLYFHNLGNATGYVDMTMSYLAMR